MGGIPMILNGMNQFNRDDQVIKEGCYALAMLAYNFGTSHGS